MLDISSWCNSMRKECANTVFSLFDNLYGFKNMFQRAHDFFSDSLKYVNKFDNYAVAIKHNISESLMMLKTADLLHIENYKLTRNSGYGLIKQ